MQATGKDAAKPAEGTTQVGAEGHVSEPRLRLGPLIPLGPPIPVYARALDALDRARTLRAHFEHLERELESRLSEWVTLPLETVPAGAERLTWLQERTEPDAKLVYRSWDAIYGGLPGSRDPAAR